MAMMVDTPGFDTLSYARRLKDAGVDDVQAEAHAEAVRDAITQGVATKADLDKGLAALKADITRIEDKMDGMAAKTDVAKLETRIAEVKSTLLLAIVGVGGVVVATVGVGGGAIALLP